MGLITGRKWPKPKGMFQALNKLDSYEDIYRNLGSLKEKRSQEWLDDVPLRCTNKSIRGLWRSIARSGKLSLTESAPGDKISEIIACSIIIVNSIESIKLSY